jgi:NAD(P)-dependent dehydrogenase (short-subunit alcohol dehydrogenase family)
MLSSERGLKNEGFVQIPREGCDRDRGAEGIGEALSLGLSQSDRLKMPDDVTDVCVFLASEPSDFITSQTIYID